MEVKLTQSHDRVVILEVRLAQSHDKVVMFGEGPRFLSAVPPPRAPEAHDKVPMLEVKLAQSHDKVTIPSRPELGRRLPTVGKRYWLLSAVLPFEAKKQRKTLAVQHGWGLQTT